MKQKAPSNDRAFIKRNLVLLSCTPDRTRTCDPLLRRQMLYPAELPGHILGKNFNNENTKVTEIREFVIAKNSEKRVIFSRRALDEKILDTYR